MLPTLNDDGMTTPPTKVDNQRGEKREKAIRKGRRFFPGNIIGREKDAFMQQLAVLKSLDEGKSLIIAWVFSRDLKSYFRAVHNFYLISSSMTRE